MTKLIDADALLEVLNSKEIINLRHVIDIITNAPTVQREGWVPKLGDLVHPSKEVCKKYTEWKPDELLKIVGINYKRSSIYYGKYTDEVDLTIVEMANEHGATDGWNLTDVVPAPPKE